MESYLETSAGVPVSLAQPHPQQQQQQQHQSDAHDFGTQVTLCCAHYQPSPRGDGEPGERNRGEPNVSSPLDMSSPTKSSSSSSNSSSAPSSRLDLGGLQHESIASLMSAGRLFRCPHCDCYFTDFSMYHIHQKVHLPDHPFVCFICQEDCQDKMGFSRHLLDHLR